MMDLIIRFITAIERIAAALENKNAGAPVTTKTQDPAPQTPPAGPPIVDNPAPPAGKIDYKSMKHPELKVLVQQRMPGREIPTGTKSTTLIKWLEAQDMVGTPSAVVVDTPPAAVVVDTPPAAAPPATETAPPATVDPFAPAGTAPPAAAPVITLDDLKTVLKGLQDASVAKTGNANAANIAIADLFQKHSGVAQFSQVKPEHYAAIYAEAQTVVF